MPGAEAVLDGVTVDNAGWVLEPLADDDGARPPSPPFASLYGYHPLSLSRQAAKGSLMVDGAG